MASEPDEAIDTIYGGPGELVDVEEWPGFVRLVIDNDGRDTGGSWRARMTAVEWVPGMACRVVEHDDATRKPKRGGRAGAATVDRAAGAYVSVRTEQWGLMSFWAETGWSSWTGDFRWRLLPGTGDEGRDER